MCRNSVYIYICIRCMYIPTIYIYKAAADASLCLMHYIYGGKTRNKTSFMSQVSGYKGPARFLGDLDPGERSSAMDGKW